MGQKPIVGSNPTVSATHAHTSRASGQKLKKPPKDVPKTELLERVSVYLVTPYQVNAGCAKVGFEMGLDVKGIAPLNSPRQPKTSVFVNL